MSEPIRPWRLHKTLLCKATVVETGTFATGKRIAFLEGFFPHAEGYRQHTGGPRDLGRVFPTRRGISLLLFSLRVLDLRFAHTQRDIAFQRSIAGFTHTQKDIASKILHCLQLEYLFPSAGLPPRRNILETVGLRWARTHTPVEII